MAADWRELIVQ